MEQATYTSVMHRFEGSSTIYRWLLEQEEFVIDFNQTRVSHQTIAGALITSPQLNASKFLEEVIAHGCDLNDPAELRSLDGWTLVHEVVSLLNNLADNIDIPRRIRMLWDAGVDFQAPYLHNKSRTTLDYVFQTVAFDALRGGRTKYNKCGVERQSIPNPSLISTEHVIEYDQLEGTSDIRYRSRMSKSLWHRWYPGSELPILEVAQRYLDAWLEILLEAGLDIAEYGRRQDQLHSEGLLRNPAGEMRINFEYGDHLGGCRIHATEVWLVDPYHKVHDFDGEKESIAAEHS